MQLIIDVGNTRVKIAIFELDELIEKQDFHLTDFTNKIIPTIERYPIAKAIVSSVGKLSPEQLRSVQLRFPTTILSYKTPLPFTNEYATPETLGVDRIALVSAFAKAYPHKNGLIIDVGTCITFDFINSEGSYKGGAISPGIKLRYQSIHELTANLPLLEKKMPKNLVGNTTEGAIHSGIVQGILFEIEGVINEYKAQFNVDTVILTGGDAQFLAKRLKNSIFAHSNFLLEGLNYILTYSND